MKLHALFQSLPLSLSLSSYAILFIASRLPPFTRSFGKTVRETMAAIRLCSLFIPTALCFFRTRSSSLELSEKRVARSRRKDLAIHRLDSSPVTEISFNPRYTSRCFPVTNIRGGIDSICTFVARAGSRNGVRERTVLNVRREGQESGDARSSDGIKSKGRVSSLHRFCSKLSFPKDSLVPRTEFVELEFYLVQISFYSNLSLFSRGIRRIRILFCSHSILLESFAFFERYEEFEFYFVHIRFYSNLSLPSRRYEEFESILFRFKYTQNFHFLRIEKFKF